MSINLQLSDVSTIHVIEEIKEILTTTQRYESYLVY